MCDRVRLCNIVDTVSRLSLSFFLFFTRARTRPPRNLMTHPAMVAIAMRFAFYGKRTSLWMSHRRPIESLGSFCICSILLLVRERRDSLSLSEFSEENTI